VPAFRVAFEIEAVRKAPVIVFETGTGAETDASVGATGRGGYVGAGIRGLIEAGGVLIHHGDGVVISAVLVPSAQLNSLRRVGKRELVVDVLLQGDHGVHRANIGLLVDVVRAQVVAARLREGQVELELSHAHAEGILRELQKTAGIHEFQVPVAETAGAVTSADADVVVHQNAIPLPKLPAVKMLKNPLAKSVPGMTCGALPTGVSRSNCFLLAPVAWKNVLNRKPIGASRESTPATPTLGNFASAPPRRA